MQTPQKGAVAGAKAEPDEKDVGKGKLTSAEDREVRKAATSAQKLGQL
jgi:hypothetical protein